MPGKQIAETVLHPTPKAGSVLLLGHYFGSIWWSHFRSGAGSPMRSKASRIIETDEVSATTHSRSLCMARSFGAANFARAPKMAQCLRSPITNRIGQFSLSCLAVDSGGVNWLCWTSRICSSVKSIGPSLISLAKAGTFEPSLCQSGLSDDRPLRARSRDLDRKTVPMCLSGRQTLGRRRLGTTCLAFRKTVRERARPCPASAS